jgi:hypothetical protein
MNSLTIVDQPKVLASTAYEQAKDIVLRTIGPTSQRVYADTFRKWETFAGDRAELLHPADVLRFLETQDASKPTLQRLLAALRRLAQSLAIVNPDYQRTYEALKLLNLKGIPGNGKTRSKQVVSKKTIYTALDQQDSPLGIRNRALFAVAFYVGY